MASRQASFRQTLKAGGTSLCGLALLQRLCMCDGRVTSIASVEVTNVTIGLRSPTYADHVPPQNPIARIEQVARELGRLADEIEDYAGPDAKRALAHWQSE